MKDISVVVTTYLHGKYIRASLESVLRQTFQDYELIVVDDESPDNTEEEVRKIRDARVHYIRQKHSGLPAYSRNRGIEIASGRWIAFLDGDDLWYPNKLEKCLEAIQHHPEVKLVCHNEVMRDVYGNRLKKLSYGPYVTDMFRKLLYQGSCLSPSATVVKRDTLMEEGLFNEDPGISTSEDYDLWLRLSKKHKFYFLPDILGEFLVHENNASANFEKHYSSQIMVIKHNFRGLDKKTVRDSSLIRFRIARVYLILVKQHTRQKNMGKASLSFFQAMRHFILYG